MSVLTKKSPEHENYWSLRFIALLQEMANKVDAVNGEAQQSDGAGAWQALGGSRN